MGHVHRFEANSIFLGEMETREEHVSVLEASDLLNVIRLDETVLGAKRHGVYEALFRFMQAGKILRDKLGIVSGFALCVRRNDLLVIGPVVAQTETAAIDMVRSLCSEWKGRVRIDVPSKQTSFMAGLVESSFTEKMASPVMLLGATELAGEPSQLFGIADPVFG